jgi:hypothetical protein
MRLFIPAITFALVLALPLAAGEDGLSGSWKLSIFDGGRQISFWILSLKSKDGKLDVAASPLKGAPKVEVSQVRQTGDTFAMTFKATLAEGGQKVVVTFDYEGKLPKPGAKKIYGSLSQGNNTVPALLEATNAKNNFELDRDFFLKTPTDPKSLGIIYELIDGATANKIDAKELQEWVNTSLKSGEQYGPRFQFQHQLRLLDLLQDHKAYAAVTLETARKVSKTIDAKAPADMQLQLFSMLAEIFRKNGDKEAAKALDGRIDKLEAVAYAEHEKDALNFEPAKFKGRKGDSKRAVLVELFTGAQCPPCVAADMAFDGLAKTYPSADVVLLQYHVHIPRPDALANGDSDSRYEYYLESKKARGTPSCLANGQPVPGGGGGRDDAPEKYQEYRKVVNTLLESPDAVRLAASATRAGDKISIKANVKGAPAGKVYLRFVLVEDWARYRGSNGLQYHHRVVRAMPGGAKGFALKQKDGEANAEVDLESLRKKLNKYLDEDYPEGARPMRLSNLRVVAFVQDDDSTEVLQAVEVALKE